MKLWIDPVRRPGPEAMAVDEWLLETAQVPVLRVYQWDGSWGSLGYFGKIDDARRVFPGLEWVRRWTGGGIVDHRADWTYTVIAPAGTALAGMRGAESYRVIHTALVEALAGEGVDARLSDGAAASGAASCFDNPVGHDLVGSHGEKIAGAGQRRGRLGLLHQGSLAASCDAEVSRRRAKRLASALSGAWTLDDFQPPSEWLAEKIRVRYGRTGWTERG